MYLGLGKSIIQFVVPPPGHGPLDILSGRQSEHFKIKKSQSSLQIGALFYGICRKYVRINPHYLYMFRRA